MRTLALVVLLGACTLLLPPSGAAAAASCQRPAPAELVKTIRLMEPHVARYLDLPVRSLRVCMATLPGARAFVDTSAGIIGFAPKDYATLRRPHKKWAMGFHIMALHELVHVAQWGRGGGDTPLMEGLTDALAVDIASASWFPRIGARLPSRDPLFSGLNIGGYPMHRASVLEMSARACADPARELRTGCPRAWRRELTRLKAWPVAELGRPELCFEGGDCLRRAPRYMTWQRKVTWLAARHTGVTCDLAGGARLATGLLRQAGAPGAGRLGRTPAALNRRVGADAGLVSLQVGDIIAYDAPRPGDAAECATSARHFAVMTSGTDALVPTDGILGTTDIRPLSEHLRNVKGQLRGYIRLT